MTPYQAVDELVTNGFNMASITIIELTVDPEDDWVDLSVIDNGLGIPAMEAEVLKTVEKGPLSYRKGLGLLMMRVIVTQGGNALSETVADRTKP